MTRVIHDPIHDPHQEIWNTTMPDTHAIPPYLSSHRECIRARWWRIGGYRSEKERAGERESPYDIKYENESNIYLWNVCVLLVAHCTRRTMMQRFCRCSPSEWAADASAGIGVLCHFHLAKATTRDRSSFSLLCHRFITSTKKNYKPNILGLAADVGMFPFMFPRYNNIRRAMCSVALHSIFPLPKSKLTSFFCWYHAIR